MTTKPSVVAVALAAVAVLVAGCAQAPQLSPLKVLGSDMSGWYQNVYVTRGGAGVGTATVTVNGTTLPVTDAAGGKYYGKLPSFLPAGSMLDLVVVAGSQTVEAKGVVPETPVITVPGAASTVDASQALTVGWTSATDPDRFEVTLTWPGNSGIRFVAVGSDRSLDIPAATMPVGTSVSLDVFAYTNGDDQVTGDATADSAMNIRAETTVAFDTAP